MFEKIKEKFDIKYIYFISVIIFASFVLFSINPVIQYFEKKEIEDISHILNSDTKKSKQNCSILMNFDKETVSEGNSFFNSFLFDKLSHECRKKFDISLIKSDLWNCEVIISETDDYFVNNYINLDWLNEKREECNKKFLNPIFSNKSFFNINNDFKSEINIDFKLDFFKDVWLEWTKEFIENRSNAKQRLLSLIEISPKVDITYEDVTLYKNRAILNYNLEPNTEYKINILPFDTNMGEKTNITDLVFTTPENSYFWLKINNPLTLYTKENLPSFEILDYNTSKTNTKVKICNVPEETYAKIEVFSDYENKEEYNNFFKNWLDNVISYWCLEKNIIFKTESEINKNQLVKKKINLSDLIKKEDLNWLYFVSLVSDDDIEYNGRINEPLLFWIINSHIMMKVSKWWEGFFFINDFSWKPLPNQTVIAYLNDYKAINKEYNRESRSYDVSYNSPLNENVFSKWIYLWKTWDDWILKVNLKDTIDNYFDRTFEKWWEYDYQWLYKSFFINSFSENYRSYLTSTWNAWIEPWNFWYTTWYTYSDDDIKLSRWSTIQEYYSHIYTDRKLYLPGESVNIKWIIRKSLDLSIPESKDFILKIKNSKWEEILNKTVEITEFWSFSENIELRKDSNLWNYNISLYYWDTYLFNWWFSVEVFKNPKFSNEVSLKAIWLNNDFIDIKETEITNRYHYEIKKYKWDFKIKWNVKSKYFNWWVVKNKTFKYKVFKQYYYENSYWDDCYYWCYWEPSKEFYTEWNWKIDNDWNWAFEIDIDFESTYWDYKYIVEVTVKDDAWDSITGSNSVIVKLPSEYKLYNNNLNINFKSADRFVAAWDNTTITWWLNIWKWSDNYNDKYVFIIKTKDYTNTKVIDSNWYNRNIKKVEENIERVFYINNKNFKLLKDWKLSLDYKLDKNTEYVFEYWKINNYRVSKYLWIKDDEKIDIESINKIINDFDSKKTLFIENSIKEKVQHSSCKKIYSWEVNNDDCLKEEEVTKTKRLYLRDLITVNNNHFSIITYWDENSKNPIENDNKIRVISEKISYNLGETAKVLVRLPVSNSKILWTIEKNWVLESEYIDVKWNIFFKELEVNDSFIPNAYIWVMMVDTTSWVVPEYKVWYTEIVVDKTDKKSFIEIKADKDKYKPRDKVQLNINVKNKKWDWIKSELTVMVVDDSLISLMWNVDLNTLEKIYKKSPFSIQTSITNIAMLKNYYFSRKGIVWWSWFWDFKWWDSAVSTRNIFKNTAYFNPSVITDTEWNAKVDFILPDNLTNFRVMVIWNSKDNYFWYSQDFIEVRKNVIIEDKTPIILRNWDKSQIGANVFNNTEEDIDFKVILKTKWIEVTSPEKLVTLKSNENKFISWDILTNNSVDEIVYTISALWDSEENSDKLENVIVLKESPVLISNNVKQWVIDGYWSLNLNTILWSNVDKENTKVEISFSNNKLSSIDKIVNSLAKYPYWCIEQTTSSTLPNVILKQYTNIFWDIYDLKEIDKNISYWISRISSMQNSDGWFVYWQWSTSSDLHITPYVLRSLIYMKQSWEDVPQKMIDNAVSYLENNYKSDLDDISKTEIYWALKYAWKSPNISVNVESLDRHSLIAYTYWLMFSKNKNTQLINSNIDLIKKSIYWWNNSYRYWNTNSDKAIFASLLLDLWNEKYALYLDQLINDLYSNDWSSYYYSTQTKNNAFMAFYKYLEKTWYDNVWKFSFKIWNMSNNKIYTIWWDNKNIEKLEYTLSNISSWDKLDFIWFNKSESKIYVDFVIKEYPLDKQKILEYSSDMKITREIYEVKDENALEKCSTWFYSKDSINCTNVLIKNTDNIFKKWQIYKTKIIVSFDEKKNRKNLTIEDYLPWSFRILNSKFKTESSSIKNWEKNWSWNYKEFNPDVVMANASNVWWKEMVFEYYFIPEFKWTYTYPPVTWYMMYDPLVRANWKFSNIEVK